MARVTLDDIINARRRGQGIVLRTPVQPVTGLDLPHGIDLRLKVESLQRTGSFKMRGAFNAVASLEPEEKARGVITYSSGNHGQAVACAASLLNVPAVVVMPEDAILTKVDATRRCSADVVFAGHTSLDREQRAMELAGERGYIVIPPFDHPRIVAGQGTAGLEILEAVPDVNVVLVPVGGGGLISGIATAIKAIDPDVRIVGVEPAGAADAQESLRAGRLTTWERVETVADGLRTSRVGELNFAIMRELVDDIVTVTEDEILAAVGTLARSVKLVVEPSGAAAPAAALAGRIEERDARVVAVVSGGNIDPQRLAACLTAPSEE